MREIVKVGDEGRPAIQKPLKLRFNGQERVVHWKPGQTTEVQFGNFIIEVEFPEAELPAENLNGPWKWTVSYEVDGLPKVATVRAMDRQNATRLFWASHPDAVILEISRK